MIGDIRPLPASAGRSAIAAAILLAGSSIAAQDWPQWRGPGGHGVSSEKNLPTEWSPATPDKPAVNIKWKTEIPGRGHSSPIVWRNRLFVTTSIKGAHVPGRKAPVHLDFNRQPGYVHPDTLDVDYEHTLKVYAVDTATGKIVWERTAYDGAMADDRHKKNTYATSTMVTDGERAYAFFESAGLYAYGFDGTLAWKKDLGPIIKAGMGPGTSPIIYEDLIIVQCDQEMGDGSSIVALNRKTGEEVWRTLRSHRRSWATPLVVTAAGRDELVASGAESVMAYDPATGRELWKTKGTVSHPIPSAVTTKGIVLLTAGSSSKNALAIRPGSGELLWTYNKGAAYVPSPIALGDYFYMVNDAGLMTCLDALTGERKYEGGRPPVPATFTASPIAFDDKILLTSEDGDTFVVKAGPVHEVLRTNSVGEPVYASPAIGEETIYIRGERHLFAIGNKR